MPVCSGAARRLLPCLRATIRRVPASRRPAPTARRSPGRGRRGCRARARSIPAGGACGHSRRSPWRWCSAPASGRGAPDRRPNRSGPRHPPPASTAAPGAGAPAAAVTPGGELVVAVAGKVRRPGLVRVSAGARVGDAVQAAGGALPGVDVALLNPARKVTDGELILVGVTAPPGQPDAAPGQPAGAGPPAPAGLINLNTATLAQLDTLPGVGPVLAQRILDHRARAGGFRSVGDLRQVEGIGDSRYEQLKELVTV
ncbi:competence protein comEA [Micromonospora sp. ATCC 39149]|nr:competence protein comEA [Micromonospora sp. ATCC 39149]